MQYYGYENSSVVTPLVNGTSPRNKSKGDLPKGTAILKREIHENLSLMPMSPPKPESEGKVLGRDETFQT